MKAIRIHSNGGLDVLTYDEIDQPVPQAGNVAVKIEAAGVNFIDIAQRRGLLKTGLPFTLGQEGAGLVTGIGPGVADVKVGDRVAFVLAPGSYAEYASVPVERVVKVASPISSVETAAVLLQGLTAHYLACSVFPVKANDSCVIYAAAGGVGSLLTQIAKLRGAHVIGVVSDDIKAEAARAAGADDVLVYTRQKVEEEVKRLTGGTGARVVFDSIGQLTFSSSLECLGTRGMFVLFGTSSGAVSPVDPQLLMQKGSLSFTRPTLGHFIGGRELHARATELFEWVGSRWVRPIQLKEFALKDAAAAHREFESQGHTGKIVLRA